MATNIPAPLKAADIQRFAVRAAQVEKAKPVAAYWCRGDGERGENGMNGGYYYVLEKVLGQGLHKSSEECQAYVVSLMDKVEQMKNDHSDDDAIRDDVTGKAYMEQFGLETFMRADNAIRANKATRQTADTFQAAYTFLDVLHVWPPLDAEIAAKVKFAKFHAVRIAKAIKAGEDPNLTNPAPDPDEIDVAAAPPLDTDDPEVRAIAGLGPPAQPHLGEQAGGQFVDRPPVSPPDGPISLPPYPNENSSQATQSMPHHQGDAEYYYHGAGGAAGNGGGAGGGAGGAGGAQDVSPLPASDSGAGYFPHEPTATDGAPSPIGSGPPSLPAAPPSLPRSPYNPVSPVHQNNSSMPLQQPPPPQQQQPFSGAFAPPQHHQHHQQPPHPAAAAFNIVTQPPMASSPPPRQPAYAPQAAAPTQVDVSVDVDDAAMTSAQKHARFAISALNFEDVTTAVRELRAALADLGAR